MKSATSAGNFWQGEVEDWLFSVVQCQHKPLPEPASVVLLGACLLGLAALLRKMKK